MSELGRPDNDELQQQAATFLVAPATRHRQVRITSPRLPAGPTDRDQAPALFDQPQPEWPIDPWAEPGAVPLFPADPSASLLVQKPTGAVPHKGGVRFNPDSLEFRVLGEWVAAGRTAG